MSDGLVQIIIALIGGLTSGGVIGIIVREVASRRKRRAEAGKLDAESDRLTAEAMSTQIAAASEVVNLLKDAVGRAETAAKDARTEAAQARKEVAEIRAQLDTVLTIVHAERQWAITAHQRLIEQHPDWPVPPITQLVETDRYKPKET